MKKSWLRLGFPTVIALIAFVITIDLQLKKELAMEFYRDNYSLGAKEITPVMPLYADLSALARQCGVWKTPGFYVITKGESLNAYYFPGSRFPYGLRAGKIYITKGFVDLLSRNGLRYVVAHELGHRSVDIRGPFYGFSNSYSTTSLFSKERAADAFAVNCIGKNAAIAGLEEIIVLRSGSGDAELRMRIEAIKNKQP